MNQRKTCLKCRFYHDDTLDDHCTDCNDWSNWEEYCDGHQSVADFATLCAIALLCSVAPIVSYACGLWGVP